MAVQRSMVGYSHSLQYYSGCSCSIWQRWVLIVLVQPSPLPEALAVPLPVMRRSWSEAKVGLFYLAPGQKKITHPLFAQNWAPEKRPAKINKKRAIWRRRVHMVSFVAKNRNDLKPNINGTSQELSIEGTSRSTRLLLWRNLGEQHNYCCMVPVLNTAHYARITSTATTAIIIA